MSFKYLILDEDNEIEGTSDEALVKAIRDTDAPYSVIEVSGIKETSIDISDFDI